MDHRHYIERYLGLYADDEVSAEERLEISDHVASCKDCEVLLATELATRALLRQNVPEIQASEALRQRILASLDAVDRAEARGTRVRYLRKPVLWMGSAALAASLILMFFNLRLSESSNPVFDAAVQSFVNSERSFSANVPARSPDDVAVAFIDQFGVPMAWDFSSMGLALAGAHIDRATDGSAIGYALYRGARGSLLCMMYRDDLFRFPAGGEVVKGIHIYRYKGFSIAATNKYSVFCIMVTRMPAGELAQTFRRLPA